jgi:hypothetical protein
MIDANQRILKVNTQGGEPKDGGRMNPVIKKDYELQIKTLQNAPRGLNKLERLLKIKQKQKEEAMHIEDTERLVTEIEMLQVVFCIWCAEIEEEDKKTRLPKNLALVTSGIKL